MMLVSNWPEAGGDMKALSSISIHAVRLVTSHDAIECCGTVVLKCPYRQPIEYVSLRASSSSDIVSAAGASRISNFGTQNASQKSILWVLVVRKGL